MPGIATGEVYTWSEGKLVLYASASGATSGSGVGFAEDTTLTMTYGWKEVTQPDGTIQNYITGKRADLSVGQLFAHLTTYNLANTTGAVNAKFESTICGPGSIPGGLTQSAYFLLYSGVVDNISINGQAAGLLRASLSLHANIFSGFGQG